MLREVPRPCLRLVEFFLILTPCAAVATGIALMSLASDGRLAIGALQHAFCFIALALAAHVLLSIGGFRGDQLLLPLVIAIAGLGFLAVYRLVSPATATRQLIWLSLGVALMLAVLVLLRDPGWLRRYKYTWAIVGLMVVAVTLVIGRDTNNSGARLWLGWGQYQYQPSEILKVLLVVFFAGYLYEYREVITFGRWRLGPLTLPPLPYLLPLVVMWSLALLVLIVQKDLGAALLFFGIFIAMLYVASARASFALFGLLAFAVGAGIGYRFIDVVQRRVDIWLDPWSKSATSGYQIIQGLVALASGGVFGTGLGYGRPDLIPAAYTDFVFAAIGEELGVLGTLAVLALFMLVVYRGYRIAAMASNGFDQLLATGLTTVIALQAIVILGGNLRMIPLTGITLPFMSYGGSSLLTNFLIVGILLRISGREAYG